MTKIQLLLYLTIGNILGGLIYSQTVLSVSLNDVFDAPGHLINSLAAGKSEAQIPLPVPQGQPPIGNSASAQPCLPPPVSALVATRTVEPSPVSHSPSPVSRDDGFKDRKAKILMNLAPGNQISSIYSRLHSPDSTDLAPSGAPGGIDDFYATRDGLIKVSHKEGLVTSIQFVQRNQGRATNYTP